MSLHRINQSANTGALALAVLIGIISAVFFIADHSMARTARAYEMARV